MLSFCDKKTAAIIAQKREMVECDASGVHLPLSCEWNPRPCTLPKTMATMIEDILNFSVREDDVFVVTFPKCGTTWMQEAAWLILNNLDYEKALSIPQAIRSPYMEYAGHFKDMPEDVLKDMANLESPRLLKTHLPANLIPKQIWKNKTKVIYVARNPKDMAVSFFHFHHGIGRRHGSLDQFVHELIDNDIIYSPFWPHVLEFWRMRIESNVFFTTYEAMKQDLPKVLKELTVFLGKPELTNDELMKLVDHLSFKQMKENKMTNLTDHFKSAFSYRVLPDFEFMRKGAVGPYKAELSDQCIRSIDQWSDNFLKADNLSINDIFDFESKGSSCSMKNSM